MLVLHSTDNGSDARQTHPASDAIRLVPTATKAEAAEVAKVVGYRPGLGSLIQTEQ